MIVERVRHSGMLVISETVTRAPGTIGPVGEPREWLETERYIDHTESEARELFAQSLASQGLTVSEA